MMEHTTRRGIATELFNNLAYDLMALWYNVMNECTDNVSSNLTPSDFMDIVLQKQ